MDDRPHILLEDEHGDEVALPLTEECCGNQDVVAEETPAGLMDKCVNCGEYV